MAGVITKGFKLSYKQSSSYVDLTNLQEFPDMGGEKDSIEVTTLENSGHVYTDGLLSYGDKMAFVFLYEKEQFTTLQAMDTVQEWKVTLPDGATCTFKGGCSVKLDGKGVNDVLTYTLNITPNSDPVWGAGA